MLSRRRSSRRGLCHVIVLDPALPPIGPSRRYIRMYPSKKGGQREVLCLGHGAAPKSKLHIIQNLYVASDCDMFMHVCMYQCFMVYGRMVNQWFINVLIMVYGVWLYGCMVVCSIYTTSSDFYTGMTRRGEARRQGSGELFGMPAATKSRQKKMMNTPKATNARRRLAAQKSAATTTPPRGEASRSRVP